MANLVNQTHQRPHSPSDNSDYGSDFSPEEDLILDQIIAALPGPARTSQRAQVRDIEDFEGGVVRDTRYGGDGEDFVGGARVLGRGNAGVEVDVDMDADSAAVICADSAQQDATRMTDVGGSEEASVDEEDTRSPLERFRTAKHKGLTVTDLVSPAWCEMEYWFTLRSKLGRKRATPMMKAGSAVHKKLEEQVHTVVRVETKTREDAWGLRVWNVIQGLRTLRETGLTRELEVWGTISGIPVGGIIDELSNICPDVELEEETTQNASDAKDAPAADQASIEEFFQATKDTSVADDTKRSRRRSKTKKVYICDVKTRASKKLPNQAAFRPTKMQLMIYHHLLRELIEGRVDFGVFEALWRVDIDKPFTDTFLAQIGGLNEDTHPGDEVGSSQDSLSMLLAHNSLRQLWELMLHEYSLAFPDGSSSLGSVLKVEYRGRSDGEILGIKTMAMDSGVLQLYLDFGLQWWQGKRSAVGVVEEEAFKCQTCDFAESCEWRASKLQESIARNRMSSAAAPARRRKKTASPPTDADLAAEKEEEDSAMAVAAEIAPRRKWLV